MSATSPLNSAQPRSAIPDTFWEHLDHLVRTSRVVIDRAKGTHHPRYPEYVYPLDYGYLEGTGAMDGGGIDIWIGRGNSGRVDAAIATVDIEKRDAEIKILYQCTDRDIDIIHTWHNGTAWLAGALMVRERTNPVCACKR